ncbi:hypothetical protein ABK16_10190 [Vibrio parahaemolyticus]|nr:hypothetical protein ACS91_07610 [Vibrio parahaemolyticus]KUH61762.1 hypothetical protein ABK16_10190 [Vibrio parahaemolyticus]
MINILASCFEHASAHSTALLDDEQKPMPMQHSPRNKVKNEIVNPTHSMEPINMSAKTDKETHNPPIVTR